MMAHDRSNSLSGAVRLRSIIEVMARPVAYIKGPRPSHEEMIRHLRIPKARQKQLIKIMDEAWAEVEAEERSRKNDAAEKDEKGLKEKNASAAD